MAMSDVFFTPSILITLAICLILISALGLFFIQKLNQQNHKLNTMFDIVNTLAKETNEIKYLVFKENTGLRDGGGVGIEPFSTEGYDPSMVPQDLDDESHTINMIDISSDEESEDSENVNEKDDSGDENDDDDEDDEEDDDDDDDDDEDDDDEEEDDDDDDDDDDDNDDDDKNEEKEINDSEVTLPDLDDELSSLPELESELIDGPQLEEKVKNLDIVLDYKKASLTKLREIVQSKGIVDDASKMKKADILKLLESE